MAERLLIFSPSAALCCPPVSSVSSLPPEKLHGCCSWRWTGGAGGIEVLFFFHSEVGLVFNIELCQKSRFGWDDACAPLVLAAGCIILYSIMVVAVASNWFFPYSSFPTGFMHGSSAELLWDQRGWPRGLQSRMSFSRGEAPNKGEGSTPVWTSYADWNGLQRGRLSVDKIFMQSSWRGRRAHYLNVKKGKKHAIHRSRPLS